MVEAVLAVLVRRLRGRNDMKTANKVLGLVLAFELALACAESAAQS